MTRLSCLPVLCFACVRLHNKLVRELQTSGCGAGFISRDLWEMLDLCLQGFDSKKADVFLRHMRPGTQRLFTCVTLKCVWKLRSLWSRGAGARPACTSMRLPVSGFYSRVTWDESGKVEFFKVQPCHATSAHGGTWWNTCCTLLAGLHDITHKRSRDAEVAWQGISDAVICCYHLQIEYQHHQ